MDPERLFYYLKARTAYQKDPENVELLQSAETLMNNNYHGMSGAGDCDCFTILAVAALVWNPEIEAININIVGRDKSAPVHIYPSVIHKGKEYIFDLTAPYFNLAKSYPYGQSIPVT